MWEIYREINGIRTRDDRHIYQILPVDFNGSDLKYEVLCLLHTSSITSMKVTFKKLFHTLFNDGLSTRVPFMSDDTRQLVCVCVPHK
jgi:hypothetical protein